VDRATLEIFNSPNKVKENIKANYFKDVTEAFDTANSPIIEALLFIVGALQVVDQVAQEIVDHVAFK
jgi:hypothetical protein